MARTSLFGRLRALLGAAIREAVCDVAPSAPTVTRRDFAAWSFGTTALSLAPGALVGCASGAAQRSTAAASASPTRVAVIGAGLAGLHAAHRLHEAGVDVTVFEASKRVGGRMFTLRDHFPGQVAELGGEFIDSSHTTMHALARELGIELEDRTSASQGLVSDVWFVGGKRIDEATIVRQFSRVAPLMAEAIAKAEADEGVFAELDRTQLSAWLDAHVPPSELPELHAILVSAYRGEFGLEVDQQSALNLLYLIGHDAPDPFRIFGESDERFHARGGSDLFCQKLAERLAGRIELGSKLVRVSRQGELFELSFEGGGAAHDFEHVVFALPFSTLRKVSLDIPLSDTKRTIIAELAYGTNAKVIGAFSRRVWQEYESTGSVTSDRPFQQVWDSALTQAGERGLLTNFLGGSAGASAGEGTADARFSEMLGDLDRVFPGAKGAYVSASAVRMHWPSSPFALGSYNCYRPGQWAYWEQEGKREGNAHFCGEHCSADFQGWMEGAAETGAFVAAEILADLRLQPTGELERLLKQKGAVPHSTYQREASARLSWRTRQYLLAGGVPLGETG